MRKKLEEAGIDVSGTPKPNAPKRPDESVLKDVKEYAAPAAEYLEQLERENEALRKQTAAAAPAPQAVFVPDQLPDDIQDDVDSVPELLTWQTTPEGRDNWERAKALDIYLSTLPEWAGKPRTERFQHVVNEVKSKVSAAPSPAPKPDPAAVAAAAIAAAPVVAAAPAVTIGDLRGGATPPSNSIPDYHAMAKAGASDEDIMAKLPVLP